jgi:hypothetical protein
LLAESCKHRPPANALGFIVLDRRGGNHTNRGAAGGSLLDACKQLFLRFSFSSFSCRWTASGLQASRISVQFLEKAMMTPRAARVLLLLFVVGFALSFGGLSATHAQVKSGGSEVVTDLKTTLEKGLRCRLPREFEFVDKVVQYVDDGKLDRKTVMMTFLWALKKPNHYQATFFMLAMREQAKKLGVTGL